jgi:hypothetical protein
VGHDLFDCLGTGFGPHHLRCFSPFRSLRCPGSLHLGGLARLHVHPNHPLDFQASEFHCLSASDFCTALAIHATFLPLASDRVWGPFRLARYPPCSNRLVDLPPEGVMTDVNPFRFARLRVAASW